ncbi:MAG: TolC family protein [Campylobacteraceae bacterium]|nr:TolC family protein [Campylobacteraceae bacterium]
MVCRPQVHEVLLPTSLEKALKVGVRRNYSILEQVEKIKEQRENLNQANAKFLPTLLFQLQAEWDDDLDLAENGRKNEYRARLFMRWNLLEGGKNKSASQRETLFLQESKKTLNKITDEVVSQVTNSYNTYHTFKKRVAMLENYVVDNENILNVYIEEFDAGTRTFIDILNAEAELYNSKTSLIGKEFEMYKSYYALLTNLSMLTDTVLFEESQICKQKTYENILDIDKNFGRNKGSDSDIDIELEGLFEGDEGTSSNIIEESPSKDLTDDSILELEENTNTSSLVEDDGLIEEISEEVSTETVSNEFLASSSKIQEFLNTQPKYYTLNITTENGLNEADYVLRKYKMLDAGYTFEYGKGEGKAKVLYGTYSSYKEAKEALNNLNIAVVKRHSPYIDSVNKHQKLYKKYN